MTLPVTVLYSILTPLWNDPGVKLLYSKTTPGSRYSYSKTTPPIVNWPPPFLNHKKTLKHKPSRISSKRKKSNTDCIITDEENVESFLFQPVDRKWQRERAKAMDIKVTTVMQDIPSRSASVLEPPGEHVRIRGDGNCFFRTISHLLSGTEIHHSYLRK